MSALFRFRMAWAAILFNAVLIGPAGAADPLVFSYRGWNIDLTGARGAETDLTMIASVKRQLDIVEQVRLKQDTLLFMRSIPIWANPANAGFGAGHYATKTGVDLRVRQLEPDKPIILHEFLHAYHDRMIPQGFQNKEIEDFFSRARQVWPSDTYMMSNSREFFAVTASVYLFGNIDRPPYSRVELKSRQPRYYQWLAQLFDGGKER